MFSQTTSNSHTALLAIDGETAIVANYMKSQFSLLQNGDPSDTFVCHPTHWTLDFAIEVDRALNVIFRASKSQGAWSG